MGSEGFFYINTVDAVLDVLRPIIKIDDEDERRVREAVGLLGDRDFSLETFLANVISGQTNSEIVNATTGGVAIVFPQPFKTIPVVVACIGDTASGAILSIENSSVSETGFEVRIYDAAGVEQNGVPFRVNWLAS